MTTRDIIKTYFQTGDRPTQAQFEAWLDSSMWYDEGVDTDLLALRELGSALIAQPIGYSVGVVNANSNLVSQQIRVIAMRKPIGTTITGVKWAQFTQGNYTASDYNGVGLYKQSAGSVITKVAESTNDGNIWKAATGTWSSKAFSSPYTIVPGEQYYIALLYCSSAQVQAPQLVGIANAGTWYPTIDLPSTRYLRSLFSTQLSLPNTLDFTSGLTGTASNYYAALY